MNRSKDTSQPSPNDKINLVDLIDQIDSAYGGNLYFRAKPEFQNLRIEIRGPRLHKALEELGRYGSKVSQTPVYTYETENPASAIKELAVQESPHRSKSHSRIHLLADLFCRSVLANRLELFTSHTADDLPPDTLVLDDKLPFPLEFGEFVFDTTNKYGNLIDYLTASKGRAQEYSHRLRLSPSEHREFISDFTESVDDLSYAIAKNISQDEKGIPTIVKLAASVVILKFQILFKNR